MVFLCFLEKRKWFIIKQFSSENISVIVSLLLSRQFYGTMLWLCSAQGAICTKWVMHCSTQKAVSIIFELRHCAWLWIEKWTWGWGDDLGLWIDLCVLPCVKQITNGNLLYNPGSSVGCSVIICMNGNGWGGRSGG